jgi:hypothetical protein
VLLVCRFVVSPEQVVGFVERAERALALLTEAEGCLDGSLGRAVDGADRWVLVVRFSSVTAYRRALSPFPVREHVIPLLSEALTDEPAAFETLADAGSGQVTTHPTLLA